MTNEEQGGPSFEDISDEIVRDDVFTRLVTFPNVLITGHQAFFTHTAMVEIAETTLANIDAFAAPQRSGNEIGSSGLRG